MTRLILVCAALTLLAIFAWLYTPDLSRAALEQKYLASPGDYQMVAGMRLHVRDTGPRTAPVLILLHGFGSSLETWDAWSTSLSKNYRVLRYDLPGFGLTGPDPTGDYSDARSDIILRALMDKLGINQAVLIGNSMGGKLAWHFAASHPERVTKLVLISPDGFASPGFEYGKKPNIPFMVRLLPYILPRFLLRASLQPAYGNPATLTEATVTRYADNMRGPGNRQAIIARMQQVILQNPLPLLQKIQCPTLLLWGEQDGMIPFSNAQDYLKAMPQARLVALPGLGHVPFEEAPAHSLQPVLAFLAA